MNNPFADRIVEKAVAIDDEYCREKKLVIEAIQKAMDEAEHQMLMQRFRETWWQSLKRKFWQLFAEPEERWPA